MGTLFNSGYSQNIFLVSKIISIQTIVVSIISLMIQHYQFLLVRNRHKKSSYTKHKFPNSIERILDLFKGICCTWLQPRNFYEI